MGIWFKIFMATRHSYVFKTFAWDYSHDVSTRSFIPASLPRCDGFYKVWLQVIRSLWKGPFCTYIPPPHSLVLPPALVPAMGQPAVRESWKKQTPQRGQRWARELPMDPRDQTGGNSVHLKALSSLFTQRLLPGPFRLTLHSHSTWNMHVLCSFCWFN